MKKFESLKLFLADFQSSCREKAASENGSILSMSIKYFWLNLFSPQTGSGPCVGWGTRLLHCEGCRGHFHDDGSEGIFFFFFVAKVVEQGQGVSDCSHPDRKSKRTTMMGEGRWGCNFQKPNYFWDGGEKNITIITAPGMSSAKEQEVMENQWECSEEVSERKESVSKYVRIISIFGTLCKGSDALLQLIWKFAPPPEPGSEILCGLSSSVYFWHQRRLWLQNIDWIVQHVPPQSHWFLFLFSIFRSSCVLWQLPQCRRVELQQISNIK